MTFDMSRILFNIAIRCLLVFTALSLPVAAAEEKILNIYNLADYIADDTVSNFEKETGIKVRYDVFDSDEMLHAKLVAGKTGYDIVVTSSHRAPMQIDGGLLRKLDKTKISNWNNLDPTITAELAKFDPDNEHLVTWLWGYTTIGINVDKVKAALGDLPIPENEWALIFDPTYMSKLKFCGVSFLEEMSDVIPSALLYLGKDPYSKDSADYQAAGRMLAKIGSYVTRFNSSGYINDLANGSVCISLGWSGDINLARQHAIEARNGNNIQALIPKQGALLFFDSMAIPADAPHPENAHAWINYILRPEVSASLTNQLLYPNPNIASMRFIKKEIAENETVFLNNENKKKMIAPRALPYDVRRLIKRMVLRPHFSI